MIYFDNASYRNGCICETLDSFILLLFLNTVLWNTFSYFEQLANMLPAFGKILSYMFSVIKSYFFLYFISVISN